MNRRLDAAFFRRDCLKVAPDLVGKILVHRLPDGTELRERIAETEAYRGTEDEACHASKGRTPRNSVLWRESGVVYVYLCYGMHHLLNVITGEPEQPQGVLLRAGEVHDGPGKLTKYLRITKAQNEGSFADEGELWFEDDGLRPQLRTAPRVGIDYAGEPWKSKPWRFIMVKE
ncbi:MAG: DNA-3-methyladenine glycosylase [Oscillospiraceae bacterium]|nr:DNA-3-methyladenine glycosylase [Oscillospiraceae bacterium]